MTLLPVDRRCSLDSGYLQTHPTGLRMCATTVRDGCSGEASEDYIDGLTIRTILPQQVHRATGSLTGVLDRTSPRSMMRESSRQ